LQARLEAEELNRFGFMMSRSLPGSQQTSLAFWICRSFARGGRGNKGKFVEELATGAEQSEGCKILAMFLDRERMCFE